MFAKIAIQTLKMHIAIRDPMIDNTTLSNLGKE